MLGRRLAVTVAALVSALGAWAGAPVDVAGEWILDGSLSDDPVRVIRDGGRSGDGVGRQVVRGINIFGIPVGSLPPRGSGSADEDEEPFPGVEQVTDTVKRLTIELRDTVVELAYGNVGRRDYRTDPGEHVAGAPSVAVWRDGALEIEHELTNGARVTERYWYEPRAAELHWMARFKPRKGQAFEVERVFYKAPSRAPVR